jgi:hypothetical protein
MKHWPCRHVGGFGGQYSSLSLILALAARFAPSSCTSTVDSAALQREGVRHSAEIQSWHSFEEHLSEFGQGTPNLNFHIDEGSPRHSNSPTSSVRDDTSATASVGGGGSATGIHPLRRASIVVQELQRRALRSKLRTSRPSTVYTGSGWSIRIFVQLLFALVYYSMIVSRYPQLKQFPSRMSMKLQRQNEVSAALDTTVSNCLLSWFCSGPRAAHTFHSTGILNYWVGCCLMTCCPCLTLWIVESTSGLKEKLGGESRNCCESCLCAFFCSCCVIAQDAESLDLITGVQTRLCEVRVMRPNSGNAA